MDRRITTAAGLALTAGLGFLAACSDYREDTTARNQQSMTTNAVPSSAEMFRAADPGIARYFDTSYAYVLFPEIGKGGVGIGAASGDGVAYRGGMVDGYVRMTQVTVGAQIGGQTYREVIFFQDQRAYDRFKQGGLNFSANASAVIVRSGAAAANDYRDGVAVFVLPIGGAMAEASLGGQSFSFTPAR